MWLGSGNAVAADLIRPPSLATSICCRCDPKKKKKCMAGLVPNKEFGVLHEQGHHQFEPKWTDNGKNERRLSDCLDLKTG